MKSKLVSALLLTFLLSCSAPKDVLYFQGLDNLTHEQLAQLNQTYSSRIVANDILAISVSFWDATAILPFNPPATSRLTPGIAEVSPTEYLPTYLVDTDGSITFPVIGKVQAAGLSKQELIDSLKEKIAHYIKGGDVSVSISIINYKVTLMGEVARPGALTIRNEKISIIDAIGQCGDLTINGNRKNILVIRDNNGVKEFGRIDLTDPAIFTSPYYYLRQNDMIYIEPNRAKQKNARYSQAQSYNVTVFSTILSTVSVVSTVVLAIITANKK
ncbi:MAG: polysaccharide biosynthesis/export family protein [Tannerellaceae bacterium]|jgi:polysaccharide export outer membrane protein|nr:polysaccharide biosynthesis/export family protein [Tannerellaceae bacterium]